MKNPTITLKGKKVYADGKPIGEYNADALKENIVFYFNEKGDNFMAPHGWFFLNLVDTPEHAQEVAAGGDGKAPIIFFPGTLNRAPNFPTVWKKKFFHKGIIAAVQGQFRGGTKLHIEYMNVRPGYRRNKIMDILITFLEKRFEPKTKEFHELTKDGTAFVKGTKRNPYPDDNELPADFKPDFKNWSFKLNVTGIFDDEYGTPRKFKLVVDRGMLRIIEDDDSKFYVAESVKVLLTEDPSAYLRRIGPSSDRLVGHLTNNKAVIREIIEKGMKLQGYKVKKNPIKPNKRQVEWAQGEGGNEGIAFYDIDPLEYLRLSAESPEHFHQLLKESKKMEFYNSDEVQKNLSVHPFLIVDEHGKVDAHEGRHRAAATYNAGENTYRIAIMAEKRSWPFDKYGRRWYRQLEVPTVLKSQYPGMDHEHVIDRSKLTPIQPYYYLEEIEEKKNPSEKSVQAILDSITEDVEQENLKAAREAIGYLRKAVKHFTHAQQKQLNILIKKAGADASVKAGAGKTREEQREIYNQALQEVMKGADPFKTAKKYGYKESRGYSLKKEAEDELYEIRLTKLLLSGKSLKQVMDEGYDEIHASRRINDLKREGKKVKAKPGATFQLRYNPDELPSLEFEEIE